MHALKSAEVIEVKNALQVLTRVAKQYPRSKRIANIILKCVTAARDNPKSPQDVKVGGGTHTHTRDISLVHYTCSHTRGGGGGGVCPVLVSSSWLCHTTAS